MNNEVKSPEESDFPKMHLVVLDSNNNHLESPFRYSSSSSEIKIAFINPYSLKDFPEDLQFVMEVGNVAATAGGSNKNEDDDNEVPAEFIDGETLGCYGNIRVSGRLGRNDDDGVVILKMKESSFRRKKLRVWGGWATGQNSVRLTPDLILEPDGSARGTFTIDNDNKNSDELDQNTKEKRKQNETVNDMGETEEIKKSKKTNLLKKSSLPAKLEETADKKYKEEIFYNDAGISGTRNDATRIINGNLNDKFSADQTILMDTRKNKENGDLLLPRNKKKRQTKDPGRIEKVMNVNGLQAAMKLNFKKEFDYLRHFVACGFFVILMIIIMSIFGKQRGDKGRRDL
jgi:hypothetical protein